MIDAVAPKPRPRGPYKKGGGLSGSVQLVISSAIIAVGFAVGCFFLGGGRYYSYRSDSGSTMFLGDRFTARINCRGLLCE